MDLSLRDALGGGGGGVPGGAPAEALLKRDFMSTLEKEPYDDKVGETVAKSDYRPLLDGKDPKCGPGMMSSIMSTGGRQDPPGQSAFSSDYLTGPMMGGMGGQWSPNKPKDSSMPDSFLGFSQSGLGGPGLPPFQTSMGQSAMGSVLEPQKTSGLFGSDPKPPTNTTGGGGGLFKPNEPLSTGGTGVHPMDHTSAPVLSPSGSMDDSSATSSTSEPMSPERSGPGGELGKQRRRKKKRKGRDEVYDFLDRQENQNTGEAEEDEEEEEEEDEEENWEWEIRESGGGGRVRGRKTKTRARLPEEWGAPQQPVSPTPATVAPSWSTAADPLSKSSPNPEQPTAPSQVPTSFNHSHTATDASPRSYEPMCVEKEDISGSKPIANIGVAASNANKTGLSGDANSSFALMSGENLSPVSQTFSFLDSVLQTPPGSTPDSQTTTPMTTTPALATAPLTKTTPPETTNAPQPAVFTAPSTTAVGSGLNVDAKPFVPSAALLSSTTALSTTPAPVGTPAATATPATTTTPASAAFAPAPVTTSVTPSFSPTTTTAPPSFTPAAPPSHPAPSAHQESSSPLLPPLEGW